MSFGRLENCGHREPVFTACLPDGKETIDTGFYYQELMTLGGWYYAPVPGSGRRVYYNRVYINPTKEDIDKYGLDGDVSYFIHLDKRNFGKLEIKFNPHSFGWQGPPEELIKETNDNFNRYWEYITDRVKRSWIVLYSVGCNDKGAMCDSENDAMKYLRMESQTLSGYLLKNYGVKMYKPHTEHPIKEIYTVIP